MTVETHEVLFSFDQPVDASHPLLSILQQLLNRPLERDSRAAALVASKRVLVVDSQQERAQYIAQLLARAGYQPLVATTSLDAYTLFLQGVFHPFTLILSEEGAANNQFFLTRLSQQFAQRYNWSVPFIRLKMSSPPFLTPRSTEPLAPGRPPLGRPTISLNTPTPPGHTGHAPFQTQGQRSSSPLYPTTAQTFTQTDPPIRPPTSRPSSTPLQGPISTQPPARSPSTSLRGPISTPLAPPSFPHTGSLADTPTAPTPQQYRSGSSPLTHKPLPSASTMKFTKKQFEKISLDGLSIGRYQLESLIGGNPIGDVYLTYDRLREQNIALKTIQTNMIPFHLMEGLEDDYNLFQQELDLLQQNKHPHISRVMNIGKSYISGFPFIYKTMPYYTEGSLARWLGQFAGRNFSSSDVARVITQLADAVQFLHNRGLLYQNFKQTNIFVVNETQDMRNLHVVLSDLPFVRDMINLPKTPDSYRYFAPEQWENEVFTSSDQYGLAVLAYELLTRRAPFQGNSDAIMRRMHLTMPAPPPSSFNHTIYPFVDKVILRALSKRPEERYESITAFAMALERASN